MQHGNYLLSTKIKMFTLKKCKMVSVFAYPDVNTREVGRTRDKRRKPRREVLFTSQQSNRNKVTVSRKVFHEMRLLFMIKGVKSNLP